MNVFEKLFGKSRKVLDVKIKKLDDKAVIMKYAHDGDVCMDMTCISVEYDEEKDMYICHTGIAVETGKNTGMFLFPRSSNCKTEAYLTNSVGVADTVLYRGEIQFRFKNRTSIKTMLEIESAKAYRNEFLHQIQLWDGSKAKWNEYFLNARESANRASEIVKAQLLEKARNLEFAPYCVGDRIGQALFMYYPQVNIKETTDLSKTIRGEGGFGSTGK